MNNEATKDLALTSILADADLTNENGDPVVDFETQGGDRLDFIPIDRATLRRLLAAAYEAGMDEAETRVRNSFEAIAGQ